MSVVRIILALAFIPAFVFLVRGVGSRARAARGVVLIFGLGTTGLLLTSPHMINSAAERIGINSGIDLVVYLTVLSLTTHIGYSVGKFRRLEKRMSVLVHQLAVKQAVANGETPPSS